MAIKKLSCPLMDAEIDEGICYDIHMNVEGLAPEWTIPEKVLETPDYKKICLQCPNRQQIGGIFITKISYQHAEMRVIFILFWRGCRKSLLLRWTATHRKKPRKEAAWQFLRLRHSRKKD